MRPDPWTGSGMASTVPAMRPTRYGLTLASIGWLTACGGGSTGPTRGNPTQGRDVVLSYRASTRPRTDLPSSAQACVTAVGETHVHVSWRNPDYSPLRAVAAERWELPLNDAPVGPQLSLLVHDGNACAESPTGAAEHKVYVNDVLLIRTVSVNTSAGPEHGLAFSVDASGRVTP
jgi:hypothetical protein